ncbi:MAG TPA: GNAT family N-acetyltransferase [Actinocrinis sp.]|nr:GNAT family N-acetyltransferase [Actinocrinis sp.]
MIELRKYSHDDLTSIRQTLIDIQKEVHAASMDDPFRQRFWWFVDHWGDNVDFSCFVAYDGDEAIGFSYGAPSEPGREWWRRHWSPDTPDTSTFAVSELMVRAKWRKTGTGERLHDALLTDRPEAFAVLTVNTGAPRLQALYQSWGYERVGEHHAFADSPLYAVMVKHLHPAQP